MVREILTLQLGNYANYVGTHLWNIQEASFVYGSATNPSELSQDIFYREGKTPAGQVTFTPRMILVDLKGSLKHLQEDGDLYSNKPNQSTENILTQMLWDPEKFEEIKEEPVEKYQYQKDLESDVPSDLCNETEYKFKETVTSWTDYSFARYHPRSINIIEEYTHSTSEVTFDTITNGMELYNNYEFQENFTDRIRQYIEECDECQGFQTIFDCHDGFCGIAIPTLEHIQDEYSKASIVYPVIPPNLPNFKNADAAVSTSIKVINIALGFSHLAERCSLFVPLSTMERCWRRLEKPIIFPHISFMEHNYYHTAALLATFLDLVSLRYRLKDPVPGCFLHALCGDLTQYGRKMGAGGLAFPLPIGSSEDLIDFLDNRSKPIYTLLTPNTTIGTTNILQSVSVRGIPNNKLKRPSTSRAAQRQQRMAAYRCESVSAMMQFYYECHLQSSMTHVTACNSPMNIRTPFPLELFDLRIGNDGFVHDFGRGAQQSVESAPVFANIQSSTDLGKTLDSLHREVSRIKIARISRYAESGLEQEDYKETLERLIEFKERYEDDYEL